MSVESIGATWATVHWTAPPAGVSMISRYEVIALEVDGPRQLVNTTASGNSTSFNITGLSPAVTYDVFIVAVSEGGNVIAKSIESTSIRNTTSVAGQ